jgi:hypothetical protein
LTSALDAPFRPFGDSLPIATLSKGGRKVKTTIIAFSAAALIAPTPAVLARNAPGKSPEAHHQLSRKYHPPGSGNVSRHATHANGLRTGYPGAFGYAPSEPKDSTLESSRQAGGGGGGSGL